MDIMLIKKKKKKQVFHFTLTIHLQMVVKLKFITLEAKYCIPAEISFDICRRFKRLSWCGGSAVLFSSSRLEQ